MVIIMRERERERTNLYVVGTQLDQKAVAVKNQKKKKKSGGTTAISRRQWTPPNSLTPIASTAAAAILPSSAVITGRNRRPPRSHLLFIQKPLLPKPRKTRNDEMCAGLHLFFFF